MSNKKILIVEDDADVRLGYNVLLKAHHYDTFFAADAMSASSSWKGSAQTCTSR
jgi:CheY-like chemotaxis protein